MNRVTSKQITQPEDWWEILSLQASLEDLTLSEWIGEACKDRVVKGLSSSFDAAVAKHAAFSPRPSKGPVKGSRRKPKEPKDEK